MNKKTFIVFGLISCFNIIKIGAMEGEEKINNIENKQKDVIFDISKNWFFNFLNSIKKEEGETLKQYSKIKYRTFYKCFKDGIINCFGKEEPLKFRFMDIYEYNYMNRNSKNKDVWYYTKSKIPLCNKLKLLDGYILKEVLDEFKKFQINEKYSEIDVPLVLEKYIFKKNLNKISISDYIERLNELKPTEIYGIIKDLNMNNNIEINTLRKLAEVSKLISITTKSTINGFDSETLNTNLIYNMAWKYDEKIEHIKSLKRKFDLK